MAADAARTTDDGESALLDVSRGDRVAPWRFALAIPTTTLINETPGPDAWVEP